MSVDNKQFVKKSQAILKELGIETKTSVLYEFFAKLQGDKNWNVAKDKKVPFERILGASRALRRVPTGIEGLDEALLGGLPKEALSVIMSKTEGLASHFCIKTAAATIKAGGTVLHLAWSSNLEELKSIYAGTLAGLSRAESLKSALHDTSKEKMDLAWEKYKDKVVFKSFTNLTIEEVYKSVKSLDQKFDLIVTDRAHVLGASSEGLDYGDDRMKTMRVYRGLASLSYETKTATLTPLVAETLPQSVEPDGWIREIVRAAAVALTLNRSEFESAVFLEKQREGLKGLSFSL